MTYFQQISNKPFKKRNAAIKENNFILYNTKALDIIRMYFSQNVSPLVIIENTCLVQKQRAVRRTDGVQSAKFHMLGFSG